MLTDERAENIKQQLKKQVEKLPEQQQGEWLEWLDNASNEDLEELMKQQGSQQGMKEGECLFCGIGKGTIDTVKIYEDSNVLAFLDITPAVAGQAIIIPKEHYQFMFQLPDQILWELFRVAKMIIPFIVNAVKSQGMSIYIPQGVSGGQRISHFAINLIPRFENDKSMFAWERKEVSTEELAKVAKEIKILIEKNLAEEKAKLEKKLREEMSPKKAPQPEKLPEFPRRMP